MKIDIPVQAIPQLFFEIGLFNEADKNILTDYIDQDNLVEFTAHLATLGFALDDMNDLDNAPTTCEGLTFNVDLPDSLFESSKENTSKSQCKSIW